MEADTLLAAADALCAHRARLRATPLAAPQAALPAPEQVLPGALCPRSADEAYAVQDALIARLGPVAGWKVGGNPPICAPVFAQVLFDDAAALSFAVDPGTELECEIAFTFGRGLPGAAQPYTEAEVAAAVAGTCVSIELLAPRFAAPATPDGRHAVLADGLACGALVLGPPVPGFHEVDCAAQPVQVTVDGARVHDALGGNAAPRLLPLLAWLVNHLAQRGLPITAGQTVTTGSWTGKQPWGTARTVTAEFPGIGLASASTP